MQEFNNNGRQKLNFKKYFISFNFILIALFVMCCPSSWFATLMLSIFVKFWIKLWDVYLNQISANFFECTIVICLRGGLKFLSYRSSMCAEFAVTDQDGYSNIFIIRFTCSCASFFGEFIKLTKKFKSFKIIFINNFLRKLSLNFSMKETGERRR